MGRWKYGMRGAVKSKEKWCALPLLFVSCSSLFFFLSKRPSSPTVSLLPLLHCFYILLCDWGPKKQKPKGALYFWWDGYSFLRWCCSKDVMGHEAWELPFGMTCFCCWILGGQGLVFVVIEKILWRDGACQFVFGRKLPNFVGWWLRVSWM